MDWYNSPWLGKLSLARLSATKQQITSLKVRPNRLRFYTSWHSWLMLDLVPKCRAGQELHSWIFLQHDAYAVGRTPERVIGPLQH